MDMDINYLFTNAFVTVCAVIAIPAFLCVNKAIPKHIKKYLYILVGLLLAEAVESYLDHILGTVPDSRYELQRMVVSAVGYCLRPTMLYLVLLLMTRESKVKHHVFLLGIPSYVTYIVALMAFFTDKVFYYNASNHFQSGPLRIVFFVVLLVYFVMIITINVMHTKENTREGLVLFGIIMLLILDIVVETEMYEISIHSQVMSISVVFYFMYFLSVYHQKEVLNINETYTNSEKQLARQMLDQSIETLAYTIDAKDRYTRGHSFRVAKYARQIAKLDGRNEKECREIYLAGLLHDIGKISIRDEIINKDGKLDTDEYDQIKKHPENGALILEKMLDFPFLQDGALYHHERYDGKGYPHGLKGEDIPVYARIIAVADAYDAMSSHRSYRKTLDQALVKQEIWMGSGTQFDPNYAKLMISLIDADLSYDMREKEDYKDQIIFEDDGDDIVWEPYPPTEITASDQIMLETSVNTLGEFAFRVNNWETPSASVKLSSESASISFESCTKEGADYVWYAPTVLVFASDDGIVASDSYEELAVFVSAGYSWRVGSTLRESNITTKTDKFENYHQWISKNKEGMKFVASAVRYGSLVNVKIENELLVLEGEVILPNDYDREVYIAISGEKCNVSKVELHP